MKTSSVVWVSLIASFVGSMGGFCLELIIKVIKKVFWIRKLKRMITLRKAKGIKAGQYLTPIEGLELDRLESSKKITFVETENPQKDELDNCERARRKLR
jgi:hypothetical protein